jgi:cohesin domain-containing protein
MVLKTLPSIKTSKIVGLVTLSFLLIAALPAFGTELIIPELTAEPGNTLTIPIRIDSVDNLAGIKLVIRYDKNLLTYKKADKTEHTSSLMHIVNDKNPGVLILVMAGPKGIKGKDFSIINLTFNVKSGLKGNHTTQLKITESQLMSDLLKDIKHSIKTSPLTIKKP